MTALEPVNEESRIQALQAMEILDTPPEEAFDRITRLVRNIFDVPMATISFVDKDRQWFKSRIGLEAQETPRAWSFCAHTIAGIDVMVVPDAHADARFADNPLVCGDPGIRFYAGAPLRTADGRNLGSLCVMDTKPRPELDARQCAILCDLAGVVVQECNSRRKAHELRAAKQQADSASQAKGEFLSRVSHELRTPMNAVIGFTQLLELDDLTDLQRSNVDRILRSSKHLLSLLNEVLEISRIEAGQRAIELEAVKIADAVREASEFVEPLLKERNLTLRIEAPAVAGWAVLADQQKLIQVILNLLSNAVKYNRAGGTVVVKQELAGTGLVRINVADSGNGISREDQKKLFQPFERLGAERTNTQGTGLGLSLSKKMMELMGGTIGVASVVGTGSTFWIELPRFEPHPASPARTETPVETAVPAGPTVLYIEDAVVSIHLIRGILKRTALKSGSTVRLISAMQGNIGLELARVHAPDLILLDLHLPDLSGMQVLSQLKSDARTSAIPVVVLTADPLPGTRAQVTEAGAVACLSKPVDVAAFLKTVSQILEEPNK